MHISLWWFFFFFLLCCFVKNWNTFDQRQGEIFEDFNKLLRSKRKIRVFPSPTGYTSFGFCWVFEVYSLTISKTMGNLFLKFWTATGYLNLTTLLRGTTIPRLSHKVKISLNITPISTWRVSMNCIQRAQSHHRPKHKNFLPKTFEDWERGWSVCWRSTAPSTTTQRSQWWRHAITSKIIRFLLT